MGTATLWPWVKAASCWGGRNAVRKKVPSRAALAHVPFPGILLPAVRCWRCHLRAGGAGGVTRSLQGPGHFSPTSHTAEGPAAHILGMYLWEQREGGGGCRSTGTRDHKMGFLQLFMKNPFPAGHLMQNKLQL